MPHAAVEIIVTFLALLELLRRRLATVRQGEALGPIMIYRGVEQADDVAGADDGTTTPQRAVTGVQETLQT